MNEVILITCFCYQVNPKLSLHLDNQVNYATCLFFYTHINFSELFQTKQSWQGFDKSLSHWSLIISHIFGKSGNHNCQLKNKENLMDSTNMYQTDCKGRLSTLIQFKLSPHCSSFCSLPTPWSQPHSRLCWDSEVETGRCKEQKSHRSLNSLNQKAS